MEQKTMSDTDRTKWQTLLRKFENDNGLVIEEAKNEAGSNKGDNYTSIMIRTTVFGKSGDGKPYKKKFMTKILPYTRPVTQMINTEALYLIEGYIYEKLLPVIGDFGPRFVLLDKGEIIMEDLAEQGYTNCDRRNHLDLEHTLFTLQNLAKWHGKSLSIKLKDPKYFEELTSPLKEIIFCTDTKSPIGGTVENSMNCAIHHLESIKDQSEDLKNAIGYLKTLKNQCYNSLTKLFNLPKDKYFTICHGDPWINNILYKYDKNGKISDLKFVDYQIVRHSSVATDFLYFVYTSVRSCYIENDYEKLVEHYHRHFSKCLEENGVNEEHLKNLNIDWFKSELKRFCLYGLLTGFWLIHVILADKDDVLDIDKLTMEDIENIENFYNIIDDKKLARYQCVAEHFYKNFVK
ncbi:PREDICTED: uncharacterized protein LOC107070714 [Polistes dominula]|uniref:Uncharacterized protein LOC107070714 n=1 Tax=Polistes dominula TaxID=743375 RepID=A0ABM1IWQ3_POLDO|nr:PREDICTED: uncharacterized protein LOC107070714 [Polistes dominula]